ncbi:hypothetical protein [Nocardia wallacei]|uniref:hypothetical protein n=1 Tax=Nocardia wallacei TaxID=480035 RepID=UPI002458E0DB|nr:hypothetical protein [Nocardia wallacei]
MASFVFAVTAVETMLLYPNVFREVPESLVRAEEFMSVVAVGDVMRPLGGALLLTGLVAVVVSLWGRLARGWTIAAFLTVLFGLGVLSTMYQWPRATILYDERDQHTRAEIDRAATEFLIGQGFRIAFAALAALFAILAALRCYRERVLATAERPAVSV